MTEPIWQPIAGRYRIAVSPAHRYGTDALLLAHFAAPRRGDGRWISAPAAGSFPCACVPPACRAASMALILPPRRSRWHSAPLPPWRRRAAAPSPPLRWAIGHSQPPWGRITATTLSPATRPILPPAAAPLVPLPQTGAAGTNSPAPCPLSATPPPGCCIGRSLLPVPSAAAAGGGAGSTDRRRPGAEAAAARAGALGYRPVAVPARGTPRRAAGDGLAAPAAAG